jgi:hypothetical protein
LDLNARFVDGRLNAHDMIHDENKEIIKKLVEVRGIGQWSISPSAADFSPPRTFLLSSTPLSESPLAASPLLISAKDLIYHFSDF